MELTPAFSASWMAAMESLSSWAPQANSQPPPPIAQAPKPTGVINRSEVPSRFVFMVPLSPSLTQVPLEVAAGRQRFVLAFGLKQGPCQIAAHRRQIGRGASTYDASRLRAAKSPCVIRQ